MYAASDDHDICDDETAETDCPSSSGEASGSFRAHYALKPVVWTQFQNKLFTTLNFQTKIAEQTKYIYIYIYFSLIGYDKPWGVGGGGPVNYMDQLA